MAISAQKNKIFKGSRPILRVGRLSFCNVIPFFWKLPTNNEAISYVDGVPSGLNQLLHEGKIDVAPSSSIAYAKDSSRYLLHPSLGISARKEVLSVVLFSQFSWRELDGKMIGVTPDSETSVALLKILCAKKYKVRPSFVPLKKGGGYDAELRIGDAALEIVTQKREGILQFDLADEWLSWKGAPFVFGLWIMRSDLSNDIHKLLQAFLHSVELSYTAFNENRSKAIDIWRGQYPLSLPDTLLGDYFNAMVYRLEDEHWHSLIEFYTESVSLGLLKEVPQLRFIDLYRRVGS
ncbi:MAG: menaquinone biosynthesis protein [Fibrobacterales bacterium]